MIYKWPVTLSCLPYGPYPILASHLIPLPSWWMLEIHPHCHNPQFFLTFISWAAVVGTSWNPARTPGCWGPKSFSTPKLDYWYNCVMKNITAQQYSLRNQEYIFLQKILTVGRGDNRSFIDDFNISTLLYSVVKGKIYLFGGCSSQNAEYCLPGVYVFDLGE